LSEKLGRNQRCKICDGNIADSTKIDENSTKVDKSSEKVGESLAKVDENLANSEESVDRTDEVDEESTNPAEIVDQIKAAAAQVAREQFLKVSTI
jgi:hypothetical protein